MEEDFVPGETEEMEGDQGSEKEGSQSSRTSIPLPTELNKKDDGKSDFVMEDEKEEFNRRASIKEMFKEKFVEDEKFIEGREAMRFLDEEYQYEDGFYDFGEGFDYWEHSRPFKKRRQKEWVLKENEGLVFSRRTASIESYVDPEEAERQRRLEVAEEAVREEQEEMEGEEREKGSDEEEEEDERVPIDREPYYELYKNMIQEYPMIKMKNNFLQRKMADYFKRRKMEHVLREAERVGDMEEKYYSKLDALWELKNTNDIQRNAITQELNEMKSLRDKQHAAVLMNFEAMLAREKEVGTGLIFTKTAKEIPEKFLERLISNQRLKSNEITEMRLRFIKLRNNIDEISAAIKAMDKIGENHTLLDYEQLKMENQNYSDKIDERDEELTRLRDKCQAAIQTLAHLREKSAAMNLDIIETADTLEDAVVEKNEYREKVAEAKHERDALRATIQRLQDESGLLTKNKLLIDMEDTIGQIAEIKNEVEEIEEVYRANAKALAIVKHNIKVERDAFRERNLDEDRPKRPAATTKSPKKSVYRRKRPDAKIGEKLDKFRIEVKKIP